MSDKKNYLGVDIAVHINSSMETSALYNEFKELGHTYIQDMGGPLITVGKLDDMPVCIAPMIHKVGGVNVLYVEATSVVVNWDMIDEWIKKTVREDVKIVSDPINLISSIHQIQHKIEKGELKKRIMVIRYPAYGSDDVRWLKTAVQESGPMKRYLVETTTDINEALIDSPTVVEDMVKAFGKGYVPLVDNNAGGWNSFNVV